MSTVPHETETDRERRVSDALAALDLKDKIALLSGASVWGIAANPDIGLGRLVMSDGPVGVRGESWGPDDPSIQLPSPTALAATWDLDLVRSAGTLLAQEARRKGVHVLLAPTVNMHRSPLGGRHFETFSEDPHLTGELGVAYVRGVQGGGVAATVKHFVANDSETERFTVDVRVSERALREIYLAPFETIVTHAHPWGVMSAYNQVNGVSMTEHADLNTVLRSEWGFDGFLISDWTAARDTVRDCLAGLDIAMPGPNTVYGQHLLDAVHDGRVPETAVDTLARRVLRLAARVGVLDGAPPVVPESQLPDSLDGRELARDLARRSFVLLRNERAALPLDGARTSSVALLGVAASEARASGGGSATVFAEHTVSPLEGLRAALPEHVRLTHAIGVDPRVQLSAIATPLTATFRSRDGGVQATETTVDGTARWLGEVPHGVTTDDLATVEVTGTFTPETSGSHTFGVMGVGPFVLTVDGQEFYVGTLTFTGDDPAAALFDPPTATAEVELTADRPVAVRLVHHFEGSPMSGFPAIAFRLVHSEPWASDDTLLAEATHAARDADVAVVMVATTDEVESEGFDRSSLALPGRQDELVYRVAAANPNTVVVVNTGSPVEMPWRDEVAAILLTWFGGQEVGGALADVLLGTHEPTGRLPTTWPAREFDVPVREVVPTDGVLAYDEDVLIGYRAWDRAATPPVFPFGHGLSYTSWRYDSLEVLSGPDTPEGDLARLRVTLANTGKRAGHEIIQVYLAPDDPGDRPDRVLAGFTSVQVDAGGRRSVELPVARRAAETWAGDAGEWELVPGDYTVWVGRSVADQRLRARLHVA